MLANLREAVSGEDVSRIRQLTEAVQQAAMSLGQSAYQQTGASGGSTGPQTNGTGKAGRQAPDNDDVIEGEFETA